MAYARLESIVSGQNSKQMKARLGASSRFPQGRLSGRLDAQHPQERHDQRAPADINAVLAAAPGAGDK
jgi:hypothetical protein